ncbi:hypothetical protein FYK55_05340 [Roseiconus nitratireducens]|uniref:Apea-like HEPN domain-containing protein n=1 Tax=Roseiconus nitratireducens TaxID=2605748 RepID=A0A5M6DC23_9BACT|nr:hypothetical protein [Roseiconus nitratireducens]KAA5545108.1 hypothetical protein FYK55_05340 [Roseiconus nitratireducens]
MSEASPIHERIGNGFSQLEEILGLEISELGEDFIDPRSDDFNPVTDEIQADDPLFLFLPRSDEDAFALTYGDLDEFISELRGAKLIDNLVCWTPKRALFYVRASDTKSSWQILSKLIESDEIAHQAEVQGCRYELRVVAGTTVFGFMLLKDGSWDKYCPAALSDDQFIEVTWDGKCDRPTVTQLVDSLCFELSASAGCVISCEARPVHLSEEDSPEDEVAVPRLRPLIAESALSEIVKLYTRAIAIDDVEFRLVGFVKVMEFASSTVVEQDLIAAVRSKLLSSRSLKPDADFILDLASEVYTHQRQHRKDSDALRLTIAVCCDALELARYAPSLLSLHAVDRDSDQKTRSKALTDFSEVVSSTRNQIVHSKLNYRPTGFECPAGMMADFVETCRIASEQCIRWYACQHESSRVGSRMPGS